MGSSKSNHAKRVRRALDNGAPTPGIRNASGGKSLPGNSLTGDAADSVIEVKLNGKETAWMWAVSQAAIDKFNHPPETRELDVVDYDVVSRLCAITSHKYVKQAVKKFFTEFTCDKILSKKESRMMWAIAKASRRTAPVVDYAFVNKFIGMLHEKNCKSAVRKVCLKLAEFNEAPNIVLTKPRAIASRSAKLKDNFKASENEYGGVGEEESDWGVRSETEEAEEERTSSPSPVRNLRSSSSTSSNLQGQGGKSYFVYPSEGGKSIAVVQLPQTPNRNIFGESLYGDNLRPGIDFLIPGKTTKDYRAEYITGSTGKPLLVEPDVYIHGQPDFVDGIPVFCKDGAQSDDEPEVESDQGDEFLSRKPQFILDLSYANGGKHTCIDVASQVDDEDSSDEEQAMEDVFYPASEQFKECDTMNDGDMEFTEDEYHSDEECFEHGAVNHHNSLVDDAFSVEEASFDNTSSNNEGAHLNETFVLDEDFANREIAVDHPNMSKAEDVQVNTAPNPVLRMWVCGNTMQVNVAQSDFDHCAASNFSIHEWMEWRIQNGYSAIFRP